MGSGPEVLDDSGVLARFQNQYDTNSKLLSELQGSGVKGAALANIAYSAMEATTSRGLGDKLFLGLSNVIGRVVGLKRGQINGAKKLGEDQVNNLEGINAINERHPSCG